MTIYQTLESTGSMGVTAKELAAYLSVSNEEALIKLFKATKTTRRDNKKLPVLIPSLVKRDGETVFVHTKHMGNFAFHQAALRREDPEFVAEGETLEEAVHSAIEENEELQNATK